MSVVIAARGLGATVMVADSACDTPDLRYLVDDKLYQPMPWLGLGFVGDNSTCSFARLCTMKRVGELLPPKPGADAAEWVYDNIACWWEESVTVPERDSMEWHQWAGFEALVVVGNRIVFVDHNWAPSEDRRGYTAVGSGASHAMGRLWPFNLVASLERLEHTLREAVEATANVCPGVAMPARMITVEHV